MNVAHVHCESCKYQFIVVNVWAEEASKLQIKQFKEVKSCIGVMHQFKIRRLSVTPLIHLSSETAVLNKLNSIMT